MKGDWSERERIFYPSGSNNRLHVLHYSVRDQSKPCLLVNKFNLLERVNLCRGVSQNFASSKGLLKIY
jgi:hypothetical protein